MDMTGLYNAFTNSSIHTLNLSFAHECWAFTAADGSRTGFGQPRNNCCVVLSMATAALANQTIAV